jgi:cytochrome P450
MSGYLLRNPGCKTIDGLRNIAINVLGRSSYGQSQEWTPDEPIDTSDVQQELTYFKSISLITLMLLQAAFLPPKFMKLWVMPSGLRLLGRGMEALPKLTRDLLDSERKAAKEGSVPRNNLLSQMIQLSDDSKANKSGLTLTEEEIHGNLFLFSAAGFDTTANTMAYAVTLLTAYPEWQDWMRKDLYDLDDDPLSWVYEEVYPKCRRILAVMVSSSRSYLQPVLGSKLLLQFETLRLFTPVLHSYRCTYSQQLITDESGPHQLASGMEIYVNQAAIHRDSSVWGPDPNAFRPSRWIDSTGELIIPEKGTFLPWSGGPRICPGMKMAQVEFVGTFAALFRAAKCEFSGALNYSKESTRILEALMKDSFLKLSLQMKNPNEVQLRWISQSHE